MLTSPSSSLQNEFCASHHPRLLSHAHAQLFESRAANDRALTARRAPPAIHALWAKALCWPGGNARETREGVALLERAALEYRDLRDALGCATGRAGWLAGEEGKHQSPSK